MPRRTDRTSRRADTRCCASAGRARERLLTQIDTSSVAGRITSIIAGRFETAMAHGNDALASRYDIGLDTIYFASLLLTIVNGSGETRERKDILGALETVEEIITDLRAWIGNGHQ